jgi:hypothetical protein
MSEIITKETLKNELTISNSDLSIVEELLVNGKTLTEIFSDQKVLPISLHKFHFWLRKPENKEARIRILEAQKLGVQTLVDKLLEIYMQDISGKQLDPNVIAWTREKTKFIQFLATKITDLYSDNKPQESNVKQTITVSWLDSEDLQRQYLDLEAEELKEINTKELPNKPNN